MVYFTTTITALLAGVAAANPTIHDHARRMQNTMAKAAAAGTTFWYANMDHTGGPRGYSPDLGNDYSYEVFKSVNSGDGRAIQDAIDSNNGKERRHNWWASQPRAMAEMRIRFVVYLPPGTYEVDSKIQLRVGTILMGDATNPPAIKASRNWQGERNLINGLDPRTAEAAHTTYPHGELSFTVGLKNVILDTTNIGGSSEFSDVHLSKSSSAYIENTWVWIADHNTEGGGGCLIAAKGGVLVQATKGTWLHSLGSEHWWLYQLNLWEAKDVFVSMLQAETNYNQGSNAPQIPPAPWKANVRGWNDPDFSWCGGGDKICRKGYSNFITGGSGIRHYASTAWDFFSGPGNQGCDDAWGCSDVMHWISKQPSDLQLFGVCSKSATNVLREANGNMISARPSFKGGWPGQGSDLGVYKVD
ncbi:pectate lyase superfamily protein domain-containing protein [Pochonia chlamydosporia 170]|uniref:Pectate lyase superfamily protein domain-containing protein n=1 Tax=Pochonia chlamydosporia 170 TaxID=1380566 RepID=A0A179FMU1_METCM|nr:pectate lyase superfamily protein domain-containing protein [Pochonia chlamydosporia 170]OAQ66884.1 pectate lyase superfamily protein domain-containing protein [Pochonia chlamydosporia 170]